MTWPVHVVQVVSTLPGSLSLTLHCFLFCQHFWQYSARNYISNHILIFFVNQGNVIPIIIITFLFPYVCVVVWF